MISPEAVGIEVFETKSNGVNFLMALCALGFFLVGALEFTCGEDFVIEAVEHGDVWWSGWGWPVDEVAEDPDSAFDG